MPLGILTSPLASAYLKDDVITEPEITESSQHPSREGDGMRDTEAGETSMKVCEFVCGLQCPHHGANSTNIPGLM